MTPDGVKSMRPHLEANCCLTSPMTGKKSHPDGTQTCKESRYLRGVVAEENIFPTKVMSKVHQVAQNTDISSCFVGTADILGQ